MINAGSLQGTGVYFVNLISTEEGYIPMTKICPRITLIILNVFIVLNISAVVYANESKRNFDNCSVEKVIDGDTITATCDDSRLKIRFYGIDAPETAKVNRRSNQVIKPGQPSGSEAESALKAKIWGQKIRVTVMAVDRYKRLVSFVFVGDRNINREMVADGWAWAYRQYLDGSYKLEFIRLEEQARKRRIGLWKERTPSPPWDFRKKLKESE